MRTRRRKALAAMQGEEIKEKIASFPRWHYQFDLKGNLTPIFEENWINRHQQRKKYFFDPLVHLFGGSLAGKRVLDLGCNAGFWSLCAVEAGCDYVLGVDGRQMHVDQANFVFEVKEIENRRYDFVADNLFDVNLRRFGTFDVVLCLGLMYHISKHMVLMEKISEVNSDVLLIDTSLSTLLGPYLEIRHEPLKEPRHAVDYELVMSPTWEGVHELVRQFGYSVVTLKPRFEDYAGAHSYQSGERRAFLCAKRTDISRVPAEIEQAPPVAPPPYAWRERELRRQLRHRERRVRSLEQSLQRLKQRVGKLERQLQSMQASKSWKLLNKLARIRTRVSSLRRASS